MWYQNCNFQQTINNVELECRMFPTIIIIPRRRNRRPPIYIYIYLHILKSDAVFAQIMKIASSNCPKQLSQEPPRLPCYWKDSLKQLSLINPCHHHGRGLTSVKCLHLPAHLCKLDWHWWWRFQPLLHLLPGVVHKCFNVGVVFFVLFLTDRCAAIDLHDSCMYILNFVGDR